MSDEDVSQVIARCDSAFKEWWRRSLQERAEVVEAIGEQLRADKEAFAQLMFHEVGTLVTDVCDEVDLCAAICEGAAQTGPEELADQERERDGGKRAIVSFQPIGVVYGIQPWNIPCYQAVRYSTANPMVGNGAVLKHAQNCTGGAPFLRDVDERAGLREGLFGVLTIAHDQSGTVIENRLVRGVTLTGTDGAGRKVAAKAGEHSTKTVLELGSNDAYLELDDADLDLAVKTPVSARLYDNDQTCVNGKRFIVTDRNYDAFVERYVAAMKDVSAGDPRNESTRLGPTARQDLRDDLHEQGCEAVEKGACIAAGGEKPNGKGAFYPATVLVDVAKGQPAYDDELFGPVASVIRARGDKDAMRIAGDSRHGQGGGTLLHDENRPMRLTRDHFDTGMVYTDGDDIAKLNLPFGGVKDSGYGREQGGSGSTEFVNVKSISVVGA